MKRWYTFETVSSYDQFVRKTTVDLDKIVLFHNEKHNLLGEGNGTEVTLICVGGYYFTVIESPAIVADLIATYKV